MLKKHIFVYGSLRSEFTSPAQSVLRNQAEFVGNAVLQGKLYFIDWYPGVVESGDQADIVHGEVYKIMNPQGVLKKLDQYEGCSSEDPSPHEFERREKAIRLTTGKEITAWVYIYVFSVAGKERIQSGDFARYIK